VKDFDGVYGIASSVFWYPDEVEAVEGLWHLIHGESPVLRVCIGGLAVLEVRVVYVNQRGAVGPGQRRPPLSRRWSSAYIGRRLSMPL